MRLKFPRRRWKQLYLDLKGRVDWYEQERIRLEKSIAEQVKLVDKGWSRAHFYASRLKEVINQGVDEMWDDFIKRGSHAAQKGEVASDGSGEHRRDDQERAPARSGHRRILPTGRKRSRREKGS